MLIALPNAYGDAATNMAIDAAILEGLPKGLAVFRHYGWLEPAVTFGYAQSYESVTIRDYHFRVVEANWMKPSA